MSEFKQGFLLDDLNDNFDKSVLENYFVSNSRASYKLIMNALSGELELKGFGKFEEGLNLESFSWENNGQDRNWWWQIQALPFLSWYIESWDLMSEHERAKLLEFCVNSILNWCSKTNDKSPLLWHDHATAFRLRNLSNWLTFVLFKKEVISSKKLEIILELIENHILFLSEEKNYSKHTNHGFDQALMVYTLSLIWNQYSILSSEGELAKQRLIDELDFAFTAQGVHKENSPGYQKFMLSRLEQLIRLEKLGDSELNVLAAELYSKAEEFLRAITMPNGFLPMIGDTKGDDLGIEKRILPNIIVHDYSVSGYLIVEGKTEANKEFQLIFKCGHDSDYHRHDDDLSIHLYYDGEVVFGDGGLGFYQEKDEKRIFLRSGSAHSTSYVKNGKAVRNHKLLSFPPTMSYDKINNLLIGETSCWGGRLKRVIDISKIKSGGFSITDTWLEKPTNNLNIGCVNFFLPDAINSQLSLNQISFQTKFQNDYSIVLDDSEYYTYEAPVVFDREALYSISYGEFKAAKNVGWEYKIVLNKPISTEIQLEKVEEYDFRIKETGSNVFEGYIQNTQKKKMPFKIKVGNKNKTNKALVILHGHGGNKNFAKFESDEWLVICPLDKYGEGEHGCWWLGENEELFVLDLLQNLILRLKKQFNIEKLFFWGSSMGGYGAVLHGVLAQADAVYAHMPQVKLRGTDYTDGNNAKFYEPMLSCNLVAKRHYDELTKFLLRINNKNMPVIFLSQNVFDYPKYIKQYFYPLLEVLEQKRSAFQVEMNLSKGHQIFKNIAQAVDLLDEHAQKIDNWNNFQDIDAEEDLKKNADILRSMLHKMELSLVQTKETLEIRADGLTGDNLYACYLYVNNHLSKKSPYQSNPNFVYPMSLIENISIKYYVWDKKKNIRVSREHVFTNFA